MQKPLESAEIESLVVTLSARGWSQRRLVKELGISRKRVRTILVRIARQRSAGHSVLPKPAVRRTSTLDEYASLIDEQVERYPDITAVRLFEELRNKGFGGGYTIVKERLRTLRPRPKRAPVERFETEPGQQGQQDWSPYELAFTASGAETVKCFSLILGFSRRQYIHFSEQEDLLTMMRQHIAAAERFKGLPREILYDNQKVVVLRWEAGRPIYNPRFVAFATHYGFRPVALPKGRPDLKGKVERPFQYIEGNCLNARTFESRAALNEHAVWWMDNISDVHVHDTTRERPLDRFAREQGKLLPLPAHPYDTAEVGYRVVSIEGFVEWLDTPYSVPYAHVLDLVLVRAAEHELVIYNANVREIARHQRAPRGRTMPVTDPTHHPSKKDRHDIDALVARMSELGEAAGYFAAGVCKSQRYRGSHLAHVLGLVERYDADDIVRALERAVRYRAFDGQVVERILLASAEPRPLPDMGEQRARARLAEAARALDVAPRALGVYAAALTGERDTDRTAPTPDGDDEPS
jgi:transposase